MLFTTQILSAREPNLSNSSVLILRLSVDEIRLCHFQIQSARQRGRRDDWMAYMPTGRRLSCKFSLLLTNLPVTEAGMDWYDGTIRKFMLMAVIFVSIAIGIILAGTAVFAYRRSRGLRPIPFRRQIRDQHIQAVFWLEFLAWTSSGVETSHTLQEAAAIRLRDLERQLFEQPAAPQPFWSRLFSYLFYAENSSTLTSNGSTDENSPNSYGTPERSHISQFQISTADGTDSSITKNGSNIATHDSSSTSPAQSIESSETSTLDGTDSWTTEDDGKIASHDSIFSAQCSGPSDKTSESTQYLLAPLPKAHRAAASHHVESSRTAVSHCYVSAPLAENYPVCPARRARAKHHYSNSFNSSSS